MTRGTREKRSKNILRIFSTVFESLEVEFYGKVQEQERR